MIVDACILVVSGALMIVGLWLLWNTTAEALTQWRRGDET